MRNDDNTLHSSIGASSCYRWFNCPGSNKLIEGLPIPPASRYAAEGTEAHKIAENTLRVLQTEPERYDDLKAGDFRDDMFDAVFAYIQHIKSTLDKYGMKWSDLLVEQKFQLDDVDKYAFGTCDCILEVPFDRLVVFDFKYGQGIPVEVEDNLQLKYYALGGIKYAKTDVEEVELVIVQPRAYHQEGIVRSWVTTSTALKGFSDELRDAISRTRKKNPMVVLGSWCKFCPAKAICPKQHEQATAIATTVFSPISVEQLRLDQITDILSKGDQIREFLDAVFALAETKAIQGEVIPGYKLVAKKSNREWAVPEDAEKQLSEQLGEEAFVTTRKLLSPAQAEKLLKDIPPTIKPDKGLTLVEESDQRKAVSASAFNVITV